MPRKSKAELAALEQELVKRRADIAADPRHVRERLRGGMTQVKYLDDVWRHLEAIDKGDPIVARVRLSTWFGPLGKKCQGVPRGAMDLYCGAPEIIEALAVTIDTLQDAQRWRSVADEPPRAGKLVLAWMDTHPEAMSRTKHGYWYTADNDYHDGAPPAWWRPLPKAPRP